MLIVTRLTRCLLVQAVYFRLYNRIKATVSTIRSSCFLIRASCSGPIADVRSIATYACVCDCILCYRCSFPTSLLENTFVVFVVTCRYDPAISNKYFSFFSPPFFGGFRVKGTFYAIPHERTYDIFE